MLVATPTNRLQNLSNISKIHLFKQFTHFDDSELEMIMPYFEFRKFKKKTTLLNIGKVSNEVFYLINGCIRLYCEKDGEELSTYFFTENMFAGSYDSFLSRKPSKVERN